MIPITSFHSYQQPLLSKTSTLSSLKSCFPTTFLTAQETQQASQGLGLPKFQPWTPRALSQDGQASGLFPGSLVFYNQRKKQKYLNHGNAYNFITSNEFYSFHVAMRVGIVRLARNIHAYLPMKIVASIANKAPGNRGPCKLNIPGRVGAMVGPL